MPKKLHPSLVAVIALIALVLVVGLIASIPPRSTPAVPGQVVTMNPTIIANLTQVPDAPSLTGDEVKQWTDLQVQVAACADYSPAKRTQMDRYINWAINPAQIPPDLMIIFGADIRAGLVRAMAADTSTDWRLQQRPSGSCLIDIGRVLNEKLVATGQQPFTVYDE
jgi:hypothetical protein